MKKVRISAAEQQLNEEVEGLEAIRRLKEIENKEDKNLRELFNAGGRSGVELLAEILKMSFKKIMKPTTVYALKDICKAIDIGEEAAMKVMTKKERKE